MEKFEQFNAMCDAIKNQEIGADNVIMEDIFILGDTVQELSNNMRKFFESGGRRIQFTDGIYIEMNSPRKIVK